LVRGKVVVRIAFFVPKTAEVDPGPTSRAVSLTVAMRKVDLPARCAGSLRRAVEPNLAVHAGWVGQGIIEYPEEVPHVVHNIRFVDPIDLITEIELRRSQEIVT
jgi:hypothetical protein